MKRREQEKENEKEDGTKSLEEGVERRERETEDEKGSIGRAVSV